MGDRGRELWLTWSQQSAKWQPSDAQRWERFAADHAAFRSVFKRAQAYRDAGWSDVIIGLPYLWLVLFFLLPFVIVLAFVTVCQVAGKFVELSRIAPK